MSCLGLLCLELRAGAPCVPGTCLLKGTALDSLSLHTWKTMPAIWSWCHTRGVWLMVAVQPSTYPADKVWPILVPVRDFFNWSFRKSQGGPTWPGWVTYLDNPLLCVTATCSPYPQPCGVGHTGRGWPPRAVWTHEGWLQAKASDRREVGFCGNQKQQRDLLWRKLGRWSKGQMITPAPRAFYKGSKAVT